MRRFCKDDRGAVILIFGLAVIPMIALIGLAIDYTRAATERSRIQQLADAAALMIAQEPQGTAQSVLQQMVQDTIAAQTSADEGISVNVQDLGNRVKVDISANVKTTFSNIIGQTDLPVKASTEVIKPLKTYFELALALDNTGSMNSQNKIGLLKTALLGTQPIGSTTDPIALGFINAMAVQAKSNDDFKVSVVPFSLFVRVDQNVFPSSAIKTGQPSGFLGCLADRDTSGSSDHDVLGTTLDLGNESTKYSYSQPTFRQNGVTRPKATSTTYCNIQAMIGLKSMYSQSERDSLRTVIQNMVASGNTNIPVGLSWGRNMLTHGFPTSGAASAAPDNTVLRRIVIVMTDGNNTEDRFGNNNGDRIDTRTATMCTNTKAAGYEIFTIRLVDGDEALLRSCASTKKDGSPAYWYASQPEQLAGIFNEILNQIITLRISN